MAEASMTGGGEPIRSRPGLGDRAPDFLARSTMGDIRLTDRRGHWVLLFTHPADFTPVCTSEFIAFNRALPEFEAIDCDLIGHSVDSLPSHIAWIRSIEDSIGARIGFPVVEDVGLAIARAYGMIQDGSTTTATVRGAFVIDPEGMIQAIQLYPMTVGRSVDELLRLVKALQAARESGANTPEGWQPGDKLLKSVAVAGDNAVQEADAPGQDDEGHGPWFMREISE